MYGKPFVDLTLLEGAKCGAVRVPMGPAPMPSANNLVWYTSSLNLMFRKAPDPTFRTVFLPPDEYIPQGEMVAIPNLNSCQLRDYGAGPAVWCQTYWRGYRGWTTRSTCTATTGNWLAMSNQTPMAAGGSWTPTSARDMTPPSKTPLALDHRVR